MTRPLRITADMHAVSRHLRIEAADLGVRFEAAVTATAEQIVRLPEAYACFDHPTARRIGLRKLRIRGFPNHLVFYVVDADAVTITNVLHPARDLPRALGLDPPSSS